MIFRLNLGCGSDIEPGCINCDWIDYYDVAVYHKTYGKWLNYYRHLDVLLDLDRPLPFKSDSIQSVCMSGVIGHLKNPQQALDEIERVLKPGGWAWVSPCSCDDCNEYNFNYNIKKSKKGNVVVDVTMGDGVWVDEK